MTGQIPHRKEIFFVTNSLPCTITVVEDEHGFSTGDFVRLTDLNGMMPVPRGMDPINNYRYEIVVTLPDEFYIRDPITHQDIDSTNYPPYFNGGSVNKIENNFYYYGDDKMTKSPSIMDTAIEKAVAEKLPIEDMPLTTFRDYMAYNAEARAQNKKLKICRYPIKQIPEELHPKQRVVVHNNQQPNNPVPVFLSNDLIHYDKKLIPGKEYDMPECVINHLASLGLPQWKWKNTADGAKETFFDHKTPRFSIRTVYSGM